MKATFGELRVGNLFFFSTVLIDERKYDKLGLYLGDSWHFMEGRVRQAPREVGGMNVEILESGESE